VAVDIDQLIAEAVKKHGIRLDPNDPAVVLVTLNRLVLEEAVKSIAADVRQATREFEEAAVRVQRGFGKELAGALKNTAPIAGRPAPWNQRLWLSLGLASGFSLFTFGVAVGRWMLR
jgi:hypothetical protein